MALKLTFLSHVKQLEIVMHSVLKSKHPPVDLFFWFIEALGCHGIAINVFCFDESGERSTELNRLLIQRISLCRQLLVMLVILMEPMNISSNARLDT